MNISTIITNYNTPEVTTIHVRELMRLPLKPMEIIVVNDGGDSVLRDMLLFLKRNTPIIYARIKQDILWNYTGDRNLGIFLSKGDLLALEDSDQIPGPDIYSKACQVFKEDSSIVKVQAKARRKVFYKDLYKPSESWKTCGSRGSSVDTGIYKRLPLLKIKGFNEDFAGGYGWAAQEVNWKLAKLGNFKGISYYFVVVDAICDTLKRKPTSYNHRVLKKSVARTENLNTLNHEKGILNFDYNLEEMTPNI